MVATSSTGAQGLVMKRKSFPMFTAEIVAWMWWWLAR